MPFGGGSSAPAGASGNPSNNIPAAEAYQPTAQPQSDIGLQSLFGGLFGGLGPSFQGTFGGSPNMFSGTPGGVSYGLASPFVGGTGSGTLTDPNNPYYLQALAGSQVAGQAGATQALDIAGSLGGNALSSISPTINQGFLNSAILNNNLVPYLASSASNTTQSLTPQMSAALAPIYGDINAAYGALAPGVQGGAQNQIGSGNTLTNYGNQILNTAFDPQSALYNQLQNQTAQQAEAAAAASGLGGSAYGASTVANALGNFGINWQNQQLARQSQGLSSAGGAFAQAGQDYTTGAQLPASLANATTGALGNANTLAYQPLQLGGQIGQVAQNLNASASALPTSLYSGLAGLGGQIGSLYGTGSSLAGTPYSTQSSDVSNALQALGSYTNIGNQQYTIPQQLANDLQSYLGLGQAASGLSGQLGALGLNEQMNALAGIGGALGAGSNLLFGSQGLSGALGLGNSGLLGGLFGGGGSAATSSALTDIGAIGGAGGGAIDSGLLSAAAPAASSAGSGLLGLGGLLGFL